MALVVESTTTASVNNADNVTITKPTGVVVGDLLLIVASGSQNRLPTVSGFSTGLNQTVSVAGTIASQAILYRIADASDVSASNYTVALDLTNTSGIASMYRISGWTTGNPIFSSATGSTSGDPITTSGATGLTLKRPHSQLLILSNLFQSVSGALSSATFSGYTITSSDANPTWTEVIDTQIESSGSAVNIAMSTAYANSSNTSDITAYSTSVSSDANGNADAAISFLVVICEPTDVTGTNALHTASPTHFNNAGVESGTTGTNALHTASPEIFTQTGKATAPTQWANEAKPSTSWTNEQI